MYLYLEKMMRMTMIRENLLDYKHNHSRLQGEHEVFENDTKGAIGEAVVAGLDSTCVGWMGEESKTIMGRTKSILVGEGEMVL